MGIAERLEGYEVTTVPSSCPALRLVWSAPPVPEAGLDDPDERTAADDLLIRLSSYRITRVPVHRVAG